jgi:cation diffusion facilitator family transporter
MHSHAPSDAVDDVLETSRRGIRALQASLVGLGATAALQIVVVIISGSVALLGDTLHNLADAFTALPLWLAFTVGRRAPTKRYTYGYGRAEDLAGVIVVLLIAASAALAGYEAGRRLLDPQPVHGLWLVAAAGLVGFLGNELVARYRIRVGRQIGSAALVADGLHARTDAFTSLAVVLGAAGFGLGFRLADPITGLLITVAILRVLRDAAREIYRRLMDAVDPDLVDRVEAVARATSGVQDLGDVRLRWIGHSLRAELEIVVDHRATSSTPTASPKKPNTTCSTRSPGSPPPSCTRTRTRTVPTTTPWSVTTDLTHIPPTKPDHRRLAGLETRPGFGTGSGPGTAPARPPR